MTQDDRIELMLMQNQKLLMAIADAMRAKLKGEPSYGSQAHADELQRAIENVSPWRCAEPTEKAVKA